MMRATKKTHIGAYSNIVTLLELESARRSAKFSAGFQAGMELVLHIAPSPSLASVKDAMNRGACGSHQSSLRRRSSKRGCGRRCGSLAR